jgi:hypothetical protein
VEDWPVLPKAVLVTMNSVFDLGQDQDSIQWTSYSACWQLQRAERNGLSGTSDTGCQQLVMGRPGLDQSVD